MDERSRQRLLQLSAQFYEAHASSFSETRQGAWASWGQVIEHVTAATSLTNVLDVGCGNGRFAAFLDTRGLGSLRYLGIDAEPQLISIARAEHPDKSFEVVDLQGAFDQPDEYDLVTCFGVFHHLPGATFRADVLARMADWLRPGGVAALSLWQPRSLPNFASKLCPWPADIEADEDDYLLGWQGDCRTPRYCHHFSDEEISALIDHSSLALVTTFQGVGNDRTNRYVVLERPP